MNNAKFLDDFLSAEVKPNTALDNVPETNNTIEDDIVNTVLNQIASKYGVAIEDAYKYWADFKREVLKC